MLVKQNQVFSVPAEAFTIGVSTTPYTLQYSADGVNFSDYKTQIPADEVVLIGIAPKFVHWRLNGASDNVIVKW